MARFIKKPLGALERIYQFVGGLRSTSSVDLEAPVTLVHDVSRGAEIESGAGIQDGYFGMLESHAHVGAGNLHSVVTRGEAVALQTDFGDSDSAVWLMAFTATNNDSTDANWAQASVRDTRPTPVVDWLLSYLSVTLQPVEAAGVMPMVTSYPERNNTIQMPFELAPGHQLMFSSNSDNTGTVTYQFSLLFWIGPKGTLPPGVA